MTIYTLSHGSLKLDVSDQGGVIEGFWRDTTPLLRPGTFIPRIINPFTIGSKPRETSINQSIGQR